MIRKIIVIAALAVCAACTDYSSQLDKMTQDISELRADAEKLNGTALALTDIVNAATTGTCVESVVPIETSSGALEGFILVFEGGKQLTLCNSFYAAHLVNDSGNYYWEIEGVRYPFEKNDSTLQFKIEEGVLYCTADCDEGWCAAGSIPEPIFSSITEDAASVVLTLADGSEIVLPKVQTVGMKLRCDYSNVAVGDSIEIKVTLSGFSDGAKVLAAAPEGWSVRVDSSTNPASVVVSPSASALAGDIVIFASDNGGKGIASAVTLGVIRPDDPEDIDEPVNPDEPGSPDQPDQPDEPDNPEDPAEPEDPSSPDDPDAPEDPAEPEEDAELNPLHTAYLIGSDGGCFDVAISTNLEYEISVSADWLRMSATKALREDVIEFTAESNTDTWPRAATITFESPCYSTSVKVMQEPVIQEVEDAEESDCIKLVSSSAHNASLSVNSTYDFSITTTGGDPYLYTAKLTSNLHTDLAMLTFEYKCSTTAGSVQIFMGDPMTEQKSVSTATLSATDQWQNVSVYVGAIRDTYYWGSKGDRLRFDPGNSAGLNIRIRNIRFRAMTAQERGRYVKNRIELRSDNIRLMQDLKCGGAISFISKAGSTLNYVNIYDKGRYIQQSYYAGRNLDLTAQGQSPSWSPWKWNPIQVGDYKGNRSTILEHEETTSSSYIKCIPLRWDMNNVPAEAVMEQWTSLSGNLVMVHNRITIDRDENSGFGLAYCGQELPAVYPIADLRHLYAYEGKNPFTSEAVPKEIDVVSLESGFWGKYYSITEQWMAFLGDDGYGMAVYSPSCTFMNAGRSGNNHGGCEDASTSYIAPVKSVMLPYKGEFEYTYYLVMGNLQEIRNTIYELHEQVF